jgi:UDP-glucose 4-epimerase
MSKPNPSAPHPNPGTSVLVTGGAGFIGSHLVERLLADGHSVTVIDDLSTGRVENLAGVEAHPRFRFIHSRLSTCPELGALAAESDFIFHLAAAVGVDLVVKSPVRVLETNLHETEVLIEAAAAQSVPVLLASTSEVYGKSSRAEFGEEDDLLIGPPTHSRWSYACSKLVDEFLALSYHRERELPVIIARLFNTVGPRQSGRYGMVLPRFIGSALRQEPVTVFGDGQQTRCFCHVTDTVEALMRLKDTPGAVGQIFNVGSAEEISIMDLARRVIEASGSTSAIVTLPYDRAYAPGFEDMLRRRPRLDKLFRATGFKPGTSLQTIIRETLQDAKKAP